MLWNVTVYSNTGLTTVNTIDKPARLASATQTVLPQVNIVSAQGLSSIRVSATFEQLENVDYLAVQSGNYTYFYVVTGPAIPAAEDTWELPLTTDAIMTASYRLNGIDKLEILDGIVERHHVNKADDTFGAYTEEDPLLVPSKELALDEEHLFLEFSAPLTRIIEANGKIDSTTTDAVTYVDPVTGATCKAPAPVPELTVNDRTIVGFGPTAQSTAETLTNAYYDADDVQVQAGVKQVRNLGLESGVIINSVRIPSSMVTVTKTGGHIDTIVGNNREVDSVLAFEYDQNVNNKRVLYGSLNSVELVSVASGMRMVFKPEDLYPNSGGKMTVIQSVDPKVDGRPYYRFKWFKGISATLPAFFQNAVAGMEWAHEPLQYTGVSGSTLTEMRYETDRMIAKQEYENARKGISVEQLADHAQTWGNMISDMLGGGLQSPVMSNGYGSEGLGVVQTLQRGLSHIGDAVAITGRDTMRDFQKARLDDEYRLGAAKEFQELKLATTVRAPEMHFPKSTSIRDYLGNGVYVLRYRPQASDIAKLDKILTMYGYKDTKVLESSDFTGRAKFNYVKASGVQVGGNLPRWLREALAAQISAGVRIWHQLPDTAAYTDGSNV